MPYCPHDTHHEGCPDCRRRMFLKQWNEAKEQWSRHKNEFNRLSDPANKIRAHGSGNPEEDKILDDVKYHDDEMVKLKANMDSLKAGAENMLDRVRSMAKQAEDDDDPDIWDRCVQEYQDDLEEMFAAQDPRNPRAGRLEFVSAPPRGQKRTSPSAASASQAERVQIPATLDWALRNQQGPMAAHIAYNSGEHVNWNPTRSIGVDAGVAKMSFGATWADDILEPPDFSRKAKKVIAAPMTEANIRRSANKDYDSGKRTDAERYDIVQRTFKRVEPLMSYFLANSTSPDALPEGDTRDPKEIQALQDQLDKAQLTEDSQAQAKPTSLGLCSFPNFADWLLQVEQDAGSEQRFKSDFVRWRRARISHASTLEASLERGLENRSTDHPDIDHDRAGESIKNPTPRDQWRAGRVPQFKVDRKRRL